MICIALGLGVLGFIAARKARRCGYGGSCSHGWHRHHHHGWGGGGRWGGGPWGRHGHHRGGLYMALAHIDATPAQERAIVAEVDKLTERLHGARSTFKDGRADLAAAIRSETLDDAALGAVLGRVDGATSEARGATLEALRNIHATLDDKQRARVADLLDQGWWRRSGSPYRV